MNEIGLEIKNLNNLISRGVESLKGMSLLDEVTRSNGYILCYLKNNQNQLITQKDIEQTMGITRSTASTVLSRMEKKEWIKRVVLKTDSRSKQISITDKGITMCERIENEIHEFELKLIKGFTEKEITKLLELLTRIKENIKEE